MLVGITVVLTALSAGMVFSLTQEQDPAPGVTMSLESQQSGPGHVIVHENGNVLDGDSIEIQGVGSPEGLNGEELAAGERHPVVAIDDSVAVVWFGDRDTSYVLQEFTVPADETVPEPDEGCPWVDSESNGGADDVTVGGVVVDCDVVTDKVVEVRNGGTVIGDTSSQGATIDADEARLYGDVDGEDTVNLQDSFVTGSVTSRTADVKVDNTTVNGPVDAVTEVEVFNGGSVGGDAVSDTKNVNVDGGSVAGDAVSDGKDVKVLDGEVSGSVAADGVVKLQDATVDGHVYVASGDFDCTDSTIDGQDCSEYTPRDPDAY